MNLVLASNSPRRAELLKKLGFSFEVKRFSFDESVPDLLPAHEHAEHIATKKIQQLPLEIFQDATILTADTTVVLDDTVLGKPTSREGAITMLQSLSSNTHLVITGVAIRSAKSLISFSESTEVQFSPLRYSEIESYIDKYEPYDKAGAYGIQEWIGMIGIQSIKGCYYNVMGLPSREVYENLRQLGF